MAIAVKTVSEVLTYEQYRTEGEIHARYDIVDGIRMHMPGPNWRHQRIVDNITELLRRFEKTSRLGMAVSAPFDVLIRYQPLQVRQPDVLFITHARLNWGGGIPDEGILEIAPDLVVEILSPSETTRIRSDKIADFQAIGVRECWVVHPGTQTVEILRLTPERAQPVAVYQRNQTLQSAIFVDLTLSVAEIFAS